MSDLIKTGAPTARITRDDYPKLGEWYWVECVDEVWNDKKQKHEKKTSTHLMCVEHIGSNKVVFSRYTADGGFSETWHNNEVLSKIKQEPRWKEILQKELEDKQEELKAAVAALADKVGSMGLIQSNNEPTTLLPSVRRVDPKEHKKALVKFKDKGFPEAKAGVERLMKEMVALQKSVYAPQYVQLDKLKDAMETVDERLFALELYSGYEERILTVREGEPAPADTKIAIRQMLRYMDEECLIDYDFGGMDYKKISDFDDWLAKPENCNRLLPEPRCVVGFKVRRHAKEYANPGTFLGWWTQAKEHQMNKWTFLYIRNGDQIFCIVTEFDFEPRLLPLTEAFNQPFTHNWDTWSHDAKDPFKREYHSKNITPDDLEYDDHVEERRKEMQQANRILFLIQGLLDRSKVFSPHHPINLSRPEDVMEHCHLVYDEEKGLPSANPPKWKIYKALLNASIKKGTMVYSNAPDKKKRGYNANARPQLCYVAKVKKDRSAVLVKWPWGTRWGWQERRWGRYYGKYGEWEVKKMARQWIPMDQVFNVSDYEVGDYKQFLCDAYLKGRYIEWAPTLLTAEQWHRQSTRAAAEAKKAPLRGLDDDD